MVHLSQPAFIFSHTCLNLSDSTSHHLMSHLSDSTSTSCHTCLTQPPLHVTPKSSSLHLQFHLSVTSANILYHICLNQLLSITGVFTGVFTTIHTNVTPASQPVFSTLCQACLSQPVSILCHTHRKPAFTLYHTCSNHIHLISHLFQPHSPYITPVLTTFTLYHTCSNHIHHIYHTCSNHIHLISHLFQPHSPYISHLFQPYSPYITPVPTTFTLYHTCSNHIHHISHLFQPHSPYITPVPTTFTLYHTCFNQPSPYITSVPTTLTIYHTCLNQPSPNTTPVWTILHLTPHLFKPGSHCLSYVLVPQTCRLGQCVGATGQPFYLLPPPF